jgi:hypothetical protein
MVTTSPTGAPRSLRQCHNDGAHGGELGCSARVRTCMAWMLCFASCAVVVVGLVHAAGLVGIPPRSSPCAQRSSPCHLRVRVRVRVQRYSIRVRMVVAVPPAARSSSHGPCLRQSPHAHWQRHAHTRTAQRQARADTCPQAQAHGQRRAHTRAHTRTLYTR